MNSWIKEVKGLLYFGLHFFKQILSFSGYYPVQEPSFSGIFLFRKSPFQEIFFPRHLLVRKYLVILDFSSSSVPRRDDSYMVTDRIMEKKRST